MEECVPDAASKKIHIISARKTKSDNGQVLNVKSEDSPQPTSETLLDGIAAKNSIPQNPKMSTPKSDFSMENVPEEADQQTSGDLAFGAEDLYPGWGEEILPTREHSREAGYEVSSSRR